MQAKRPANRHGQAGRKGRQATNQTSRTAELIHNPSPYSTCTDVAILADTGSSDAGATAVLINLHEISSAPGLGPYRSVSARLYGSRHAIPTQRNRSGDVSHCCISRGTRFRRLAALMDALHCDSVRPLVAPRQERTDRDGGRYIGSCVFGSSCSQRHQSTTREIRMRSSRRGLCILSIAAVTAALAILTPASASAAQPMPVPPATSGDSGVLVKPTEVPKYARHSLSAAAKMSAKETCTPTTDKTSVCLETIAPVKPDLAAPKATRAAVQPFPEWCADSTGTPVSGSRTEACQVNGLRYTTRLTVNGTTTVTGQVTMNVFNYTFASVNLPNWQHQIGIAPLPGGWGPAAGATLTATFGVDGDCYTIGTPDFPAQALSPLDNVMRTGTAGAETTATAVDARGSCTTSWTFTATTPGYSDSSQTYEMWETDCDNATGANGFRPARVGCAVWWFPAIVYYSRSTHPTLADHVPVCQGELRPAVHSKSAGQGEFRIESVDYCC